MSTVRERQEACVWLVATYMLTEDALLETIIERRLEGKRIGGRP